jgi:hypothetical protein
MLLWSLGMIVVLDEKNTQVILFVNGVTVAYVFLYARCGNYSMPRWHRAKWK